MVQMAQSHYFPEYPSMHPVRKKKVRQNVWRKWREDSELDMDMALLSDTVDGNFSAEAFIKDKDDLEQCKSLLREWFHKIKICHIENLSSSFIETKELSGYPEQSQLVFLRSLLEFQEQEAEIDLLTRAQIEISFISGTRNKENNLHGGTLCRAEYMEVLLRCCQ
jgi:hypothetical protein